MRGYEVVAIASNQMLLYVRWKVSARLGACKWNDTDDYGLYIFLKDHSGYCIEDRS